MAHFLAILHAASVASVPETAEAILSYPNLVHIISAKAGQRALFVEALTNAALSLQLALARVFKNSFCGNVYQCPFVSLQLQQPQNANVPD